MAFSISYDTTAAPSLHALAGLAAALAVFSSVVCVCGGGGGANCLPEVGHRVGHPIEGVVTNWPEIVYNMTVYLWLIEN